MVGIPILLAYSDPSLHKVLSETFYGPEEGIHEIYEVVQEEGYAVETSSPVKEFVVEGLDLPLVMFTNADNNTQTGALDPTSQT